MNSLSYTKETKIKVNFLSRIFGVFSEEIVKIWCDNKNNNDFEYIGKPHIKEGNKRPIVLDHLLKSKNTYFIVEQKNFHGYKNGKLSSMEDTDEFFKNFESWSIGKSKNQKSKAWDIFINFTKKPKEVKYDGKIIPQAKTLLIWSKGTDVGRYKFVQKYGISKVLFLEQMKNDLIKWKDPAYIKLIKDKKKWIAQLFNDLLET
ncbi:MAG: hypothetical protein IPO16_08865 [Saprospiraceae bacterium]|nr:hypothetical protein [Saprospiraceae bacterium]